MPEYTHEYDEEAQDVKDISILCGVTQQQHGFFVSRAEPIPFYGFIANLGDVPKRSLTRRNAANTVEINKLKLAEMFPWYEEFLKRNATEARRHAPASSATRTKRLADAPALDEDVLTDIHKVVEELRAEWESTHGHETSVVDNFKAEHRGGLWTAAMIGVPADSVRGICCSAEAKKFCRRWKLRRYFGVAFAGLGGVKNAEILVWAWCVRMSYFLAIWAAADYSAGFVFTQEHTNSFNEDDDLRNAVLTWPETSWCMKKVGELRRICPIGAGRGPV